MTEIPRTAEDLVDPDAKPDEAAHLIDRVNASDPAQVRRKDAADKVRELTDEADLREVLSLASGAGVRAIARIILTCGWNTPYQSFNYGEMSNIAGRRQVAYQLEQWISDADLELWICVRRELERYRPKPKTSENAQRRGGRSRR